MTTRSADATTAISCRALSRSFGGTRALRDVDLEIPAGSVHALVGENGAGKSTCLGVIAGRIAPSSGEVRVFDERFAYGDPRAAMRLGVAAVYQELTIIPALSPQVNAFLEAPPTRWGLIRKRAMRRRYVEVCEQLGIAPAPDVPAGELAVGAQQLVEIVRGISAQARVLLLDEPTAALAIAERDALFRLVGSLRERGVTIVFVSHNLDEVLENADAITVFRDGELVATRPRAEWTKRDLVASMLGSDKAAAGLVAAELDEADPAAAVAALTATVADAPVVGEAAPGASPSEPGELALRVRGLSIPRRLHGVDLDVRRGEVLGLAGLMGSGRTSVLRALAGAEPEADGELAAGDRSLGWPRSPRAARRLGIAFIPEDRKAQGLALEMSASDNVALPDFGATGRLGRVSPRGVARRVAPLLRAVGVDASKARVPARTLSGGNQQKLLVARAHFEQPRILLADEPTRGVDIGAKTEILQELRRLAHDEGLAVVLVSSELEEVTAFSDRVVLMVEGRVHGTFDNRGGGVTPSTLLMAAFGAAAEVA
ncbi:sugar ABC transporter ATP-binding protein [Conexibacter sp. CPCC 206217]|uniref:sugar ABC transporter ATP-binding protein n=1 Tax=Conexibacter sp. CPCC 206217 TaxID=3064574 RepID=UPI0027168B6E|nr:sugar ABC transporter ATP-binding protein [Conexibacter sp. CPCC 206217]MDO8212222.1 sugar ABC transporter ATP-binding protein [Conexibacter sp. CPCC 206217]